MVTIPLQPIPSQNVKLVLGGQNCEIAIYQKDERLFFDIVSNGEVIVDCVICLNIIPLVCRGYLGFIGNLLFIDTQGNDDPLYFGLGDRWQLVYLDATEYGIVQQ